MFGTALYTLGQPEARQPLQPLPHQSIDRSQRLNMRPSGITGKILVGCPCSKVAIIWFAASSPVT
ncbi:MAG: hypothetical protein KME47_01405 [Nodosilinea sp. WJT8-NPBG4]|nr:hypothetical protein [Nodosilinea sp. WJT8-NPBG4]